METLKVNGKSIQLEIDPLDIPNIRVDFKLLQVVQSNWHDYSVLRMPKGSTSRSKVSTARIGTSMSVLDSLFPCF